MTTATSRRAGKNRYVFIGKTTTLHVHHDAFLYLSLPSLHDFDVRKCQISRFLGDVTKTKRQKYSTDTVFQNSPSKEIVNISQIERVGIKRDKVFTILSDTVEPRYNEGPRDWQNVFAITRFCISRLFFIYFTITVGKKLGVIPRTSLYRGSFCRGSTQTTSSPPFFHKDSRGSVPCQQRSLTS